MAKRRSASGLDYGGLEPRAVQSEAIRLFYEEGIEADRVMQRLQDKGVVCHEDHIRNWARLARKEGQLRFIAPCEDRLVSFIKSQDSNRRLNQVEVVLSSEVAGIASRGAEMLCRIMRDHGSDKVIHIGLAGGKTPGLMAKALAGILSDPAEHRLGEDLDEYPQKIFFHSLVGVLDHADPGIDPNTYSMYFLNAKPAVRDRVRFLSFPAPGILKRDEREKIEPISLIRHSREHTLDVIVTSCGHTGSGHASFWDHIDQSCQEDKVLKEAWEKTKKQLEKRNVLGDVAWLPVNEEGVIDVNTNDDFDVWATTLLSRDELIEFGQPPKKETRLGGIGHGKILLLVAPCSGSDCNVRHRSKGKLLAGILETNRSFITHLVVDIQSARDYEMQVRKSRRASVEAK